VTTFEVFSYWNMTELQLVFNAVAAIVGSGDFLGLLRTLALVGMISLAMAVLAGLAQAPDFGRWVIMLAIFNGMLLVPKATVVLTDSTGTQGRITVANVPLGLASFASSVSHIGDWLTRSFETTFALPSDIQFRLHGTLWGQRVQEEMLHTKFTNSILTSNLLEFYRECIVPEYATGYIVASDLAKSNDIWTYLSGKTNPGRLVTIGAVPGSTPVAGTYGCDIAYGFLTTQIAFVNTDQINSIGSYLFPGVPTAAANAAIQGSIQTSTNYILGISSSAVNTVRQTAMSNFMIDAQYMLPAQIGDAAGAASNLAQAQAIRSTSDSYNLMAKLATSTMPKVKNIVEIVQYSVFPIIMLIVMLCGHKGGLVLKAYVMSLFWVQLWPPLYAVLHLVMTVHAQDLATMTGGHGLSMSQYSLVNNAYISDEAIAGMIAATAIPAIAAAIVKGGDVGAQAIAGMVSPSREADKVASSIASGNIQMGNGSMNNQSADNLSQGHVDTQPTYNSGTMKSTTTSNTGIVTDNGGATTWEALGSKVTADSNTGAIANASLAGYGMAGSSAGVTAGRGASDGDYSGKGTASQTGTNASLGDTKTSNLTTQQSAGFERAFEQALATKTGGSNNSSATTGTGTGQSTSHGDGGSVALHNSEGVGVDSKAFVAASSSGTPGKTETPNNPETHGDPKANNGRMAKLTHALGVAGGWIHEHIPVSASSALAIKTDQAYKEDANKTIATASQAELKQATAIVKSAMDEVAGTTRDAGIKQAAKSISSTLGKAKTFDSKEVASLLTNHEAGNKRGEGQDNKAGATVDQSKLMWDEATRETFGHAVNNIHDITPKQFRDFAQHWANSQGFREDVAWKVADQQRQDKLLHKDAKPPETPGEIAAEGSGNVNKLTHKGHAAVDHASGANNATVVKQQHAPPSSTPSIQPAVDAHNATQGEVNTAAGAAQGKVHGDAGAIAVATELYQTRQRGVGQVMANAFLGGSGSASTLDYANIMSDAAKKDTELADGLRIIGQNQQHGQGPSKEEIQWVSDRAMKQIDSKEGLISQLNQTGLNLLSDVTGGATKPASAKPTVR